MYEKLMLKLYKLRTRLETATGDKDVMDILEAYHYFMKGKGPDCSYAKQCVSFFKQKMFSDVKKDILDILDLIQVEEEKDVK